MRVCVCVCAGLCLRRCHVSVSAAAVAAVSDVQIFLHAAQRFGISVDCVCVCVEVCVHACIDCSVLIWKGRDALSVGMIFIRCACAVFVRTATVKIFTFVQFRVASISAE